ncbi:MAG: hypothetical protein H6695_07475 [Deferribacteres bacterium]|nr:hypothetical protein [candidate division KSB1 bacterium]MCB9510004.1 hypothetical protein [Deferribacteres bacterium]
MKTFIDTLSLDYCLVFDYEKLSENPSRVFRAASDLIDAFQEFDIQLAHSINKKITPKILLQDIESGSFKTWLRTILISIDDDALKNLDAKKIVGGFLLKGKEKLVTFLENKDKISDSHQVAVLQNEIYHLAEQTEVLRIPAYAPIPTYRILRSLERISSSLANLNSSDKAFYITRDGEFAFNTSFKIASEAIEDFATKETISNDAVMILKVKKPDFLGDSMWEFKYAGRALNAKVTHTKWLSKFQSRKVQVNPGDSIRANVHTDVKYGYDNDVIAVHYFVTNVLEVLETKDTEQKNLFDAND